jgi:hypothetical protein
MARMTTLWMRIAIGAGVLCAIGCGAKNAGTPPTGDAGASDDASTGADSGAQLYTWYQDVQPIVASHCQLCHASPPLYGAPRSLMTYADTQAAATTGEPMYQVMAYRVVARQNPMPPPGQPQLTGDQKKIIIDWANEGAPEGTPPDVVDAGVNADAATNSDAQAAPDATAGADAQAGQDATVQDGGNTVLTFSAHASGSNAPYPLIQAQTNYQCWAFPVPAQVGTQHAIRFEPFVDNAVHLHHMIFFRNTSSPESPGPFDCSGFPMNWEMIGGWAPGRTAVDMPPGVGVPIHTGDQLILQAHYNQVTDATQTDQSGFRMTLTNEPNLIDAGILWSGLIFLSPINGSNVSKTYTCSLGAPITIFSDFPHMHQTGLRITLDVLPSGQSNWTNLVDVSPWSFFDQPNIDIPPAAQQLQSGDQLRTTCWWDTQGRTINYGEASSDEMCFNFIYHYPLMSNQFGCVGTAP